ncbi:MAG: TIGR02679 domain-containing protein [Lachnospiraceae bacterium]|nr:TIGR02679 domain-containing protein [Lachnospiraceae bacterium]
MSGRWGEQTDSSDRGLAGKECRKQWDSAADGVSPMDLSEAKNERNVPYSDAYTEKMTAECAQYFREQPVLNRLLKGFREKYLSYGSFSGSVILRNLKEEDRDVLEGFLGKNYHGKKSASISAAQFRKSLSESRFGGISPEALLRRYFGEELIGKKERRLAEREAFDAVFDRMQKKYAGTPAGSWIRELCADKVRNVREADPGDFETAKRSQSAGSAPGRIWYWLMNRYREGGRNPEVLEQDLDMGSAILNAFPCRKGETEYLAVFAARLTGNPHAFDDGGEGGQLLSLTILWELEGQNPDSMDEMIFPALRKQRQYLAAGILRDDMSNYAMLSGVRAQKKDGSWHTGMEGFRTEGEPVQVPLSVIAGWERVECPDNRIYIVENPSIYALLCQRWKGTRACMCMNGQPRLSAVLMLDLLAKADAEVYYAGDFDPEGLLIAQKVKLYYAKKNGRSLHFWHMSAEDCRASLSDERISDKRLKMLERVTDPELKMAANLLFEKGVAGYQENIWERYQ